MEVGAPVTGEDIGIDNSIIVDSLVKASSIRPDRYTILSERSLTQESATRLARETGVI